MNEKSTIELEQILGSTHPKDFEAYCVSNKESVNGDELAFVEYFKSLFKEKCITQQMVFLKADIPERYGYKLLSGEKHTKQRDVILRICYAAEFTLKETQRALRKYGMPELYAKVPRDALLMIAFNDRPGSILEVNELLQKNGMQPLRTSGIQE
ncbi:MAG: hypothetical protein J6J44_04160 [Lachnospiraceae bacterium]|nr:hypothetical protein [Lachnospiraceae bacterium]